MNATIHKWQFPPEQWSKGGLNAPRGARFLCVHVQHGVPCIWAEVDPKETIIRYNVRVVGTGHPLRDGMQYLGTFILERDTFVGHVYIGTEA